VRYVFRFVWVAFLSSLLLTCAARIFIPSFDRARETRPEDRAEDVRDGVCIWTAILLIPTVDLVVNLRKRSASPLRQRLSRCAACGYDLRATPDRCPECGAVPPPQPARPGGTGG
jgi:hypothetical protein